MAKTRVLQPDSNGIGEAVQLLHDGALVAFPTETVYGLGADARNGEAVAGIFAAKGRPSFNPLIVHVASLDAAEKLVELPPELRNLGLAFWPGAITLVAPLRPASGLSDLVSAGLPTIAVRVPSHPLALSILETFGGPVAAPSANPSGQISPTTSDHVMDGLNGKIAAVVNGGPCAVGLESTIVGYGANGAVLLRPGGVPSEAIEAALGQPLHPTTPDKIEAPGQMLSHYAPSSQLRMNADAPTGSEAYLAFGNSEGLPNCLDLSKSGDLREAASSLFAHLRDLDAMVTAQNLTGIAACPIPETGLGLAINDRLNRASAPKTDS